MIFGIKVNVMSKLKVGDRVMYSDKLCKVLYVYDDGAVKLQAIRGKSKCVYFHVPLGYIQKLEDPNG